MTSIVVSPAPSKPTDEQRANTIARINAKADRAIAAAVTQAEVRRIKAQRNAVLAGLTR